MPKQPMVNLTRLQELMRVKTWGISDLAFYSKVKYDTVYSLVKGRRRNTTAQTLKAIADALETNVDYLLDENEDKAPARERLPEPVRQLADIASNLSEVRQEELIRIAAALQKLEEEQQTLTTPTVMALMELHEKLVAQGVAPDLLELLESLLPPPRRVIHLHSRKRTHKPGEKHGGM